MITVLASSQMLLVARGIELLSERALPLQTLGMLINVDLPWNPSRLGCIKRLGQARSNVDMLHLVFIIIYQEIIPIEIDFDFLRVMEHRHYNDGRADIDTLHVYDH